MEDVIAIVLIVALGIDIIVNVMKIIQTRRLWKLVRMGECSYIKLVQSFLKINNLD